MFIFGENTDLGEDLQDSEKKAAENPKPSLLCSGLFVMCIANCLYGKMLKTVAFENLSESSSNK